MSKVDKKMSKIFGQKGSLIMERGIDTLHFFLFWQFFLAFFSKKLIARFLVAHLGMTLYMTFASSDFKELGGVMVMRPDCDTKGYGFKSQEMPKLFFFFLSRHFWDFFFVLHSLSWLWRTKKI